MSYTISKHAGMDQTQPNQGSGNTIATLRTSAAKILSASHSTKILLLSGQYTPFYIFFNQAFQHTYVSLKDLIVNTWNTVKHLQTEVFCNIST